MINLIRTPKPDQLTKEKVEKLTSEYKNTKKPVWNKDFIKQELLKMSNKKCVYCEAPLEVPGVYMEVDHFFPKSIYEDKVVEWDNLLPSCKTCNIKKGNHDPKTEKIIDPTIDIPNEHLEMKNFRLIGKDSVGKATIKILNLNNLDRNVLRRFELGNTLIEQLEKIENSIPKERKENTSSFSDIRNSVQSLLEQVQRDKEYSGTLASIMMNSSEYHILKGFLTEIDLWDEEFEVLEKSAKEIAL
ncbi:HNH endonuclease [Enterococcus sp. AZ126]|uniref:HNH endonuclease n=1 Tax=Enterococcus sp. AZ126 TaxID=2774635 RepID=UPI003F26C18E